MNIVLHSKSLPALSRAIEESTAAVLADEKFLGDMAKYMRIVRDDADAMMWNDQASDVLSRLLERIQDFVPNVEDTAPTHAYEFTSSRGRFHDESEERVENIAVVRRAGSSLTATYGWNDVGWIIDADTEQWEDRLVGIEAAAGLRGTTGPSSPSSSIQKPSRRTIEPPPDPARQAKLVFSQGNRRHVLGLSINRLSVRFWLFDRAGSIRTPGGNDAMRLNEPSFISHFLRFLLHSDEQLGLEGTFEPESKERSSMSSLRPEVGARIRILPSEEYKVLECLHVQKDLYGRGTSVWMCELASGRPSTGSANGQSEMMGADEELEEGYVDPLVGPIPQKVVIKFTWQRAEWPDESELHHLVAQAGVQGVAKLYRTRYIERLSRHFRGRLLDASLFRDRELRAQVFGPVCQPLRVVKELEKFKAAFISLVQAHHDMYEKTGILHHDINLENLMVDETDHSKGILIDLDLAIRIHDHATGLPIPLPEFTSTPLPGGTLPFRAISLLEQGNQIHTLHYRYDLESFLYVLIWTLSHHPLEHASSSRSKASTKALSAIESWTQGTLTEMAQAKRAHLRRMAKGEASALPTGQLGKAWLIKLAKLFEAGYRKLDEDPGRADVGTMGGVVTFEAFMAVLQDSG
ncbi:hypothetical protein DL93DRAFT_2077061 [Clavulina sp. PMI_390]|nr:hypothetical protein DL93DRAFT_2077061 [Clavulina sp. PMI_390]